VTDESSENDLLLHAIDLATLEEFDRAKHLLEPLDDAVAGRLFLLICALELQQQSQIRTITEVRHEIGNAISVAQANLEGMADGLVRATPERLEAVAGSLRSAGGLLDRLRRAPRTATLDAGRDQTGDVGALIDASVASIRRLASSKSVKIVSNAAAARGRDYRGDPSHVAQLLRGILIDAVRATPPGGIVHVADVQDDRTVHVIARVPSNEEVVFEVKLPLA
jgi:signal transduction histidine kinase